MANLSNALVAQDPKAPKNCEFSQTSLCQLSSLKEKEVTDDKERVVLDIEDVEDEDFFTQEELDKMDNPMMAYMARKFKNVRFNRNKSYKPKGQMSRFNRGGFSRNAGDSEGGYRTGLVDRSKFRCYNCNELGHFADKCKKPSQLN